MEQMMERVRDSYEFPTDLGGDADPGALRWTVTVIALTTALLAVLNAQSLRGWAEEVPPEQPGAMTLVAAATTWEETTASAGLSLGRAQLHKAWKGMESARWTPQGRRVEEARR